MRWPQKNRASHGEPAPSEPASPTSRRYRVAAGFLATATGAALLLSARIPVSDPHHPAPELGKAPTPLIRIRRNPRDGAEVVYVPPGRFTMGHGNTVADVLLGNTWPHSVQLTRGFWIYRTEITNAQYRRFVADTHYRAPRPSLAADTRFNRADQPVAGVNWQGALDYCRWAKGRLPTEAEWEYAAGGALGREYPWGSNRPSSGLAVYDRNPRTAGPELVGRRLQGAGPFGALDMAGNVWEWCSDWSSALSSQAARDPQGPPTGHWRVVKGGAWLSAAGMLQVRERYGYSPEERPFTTGFRPVLPDTAEPSLLPN